MLQNTLSPTPSNLAEAPVSPARKNIPAHLKKYVVEQNYDRYTAEDQAVWRFLMRQLKDFLSTNAHPCYVEGLERTGISVEEIPHINQMDERLSEFGWGAVPVSGFIPPAAFMEFQSLGILPIASDMRSIDHLTYTPAPDIVHEAAGHAPILINPEFAEYLKRYADVAKNAIISRQDMDQYEAIRRLSDVKENPASTPAEIQAAETHLNEVNKKLTSVSEAGWLSRMNWWTAEYGLIGPLMNPKIYGAGLLSSLGESKECLSAKVLKLPLSIDCIDISYDITEPQPQLFVAPDFNALNTVLDQLATRMAFRMGGSIGLQRAKQAEALVTVELDSGLQISGVLSDYKVKGHDVDFVRFSGPVALALDNHQLPEHGRQLHAQGFSSPLGRIEGFDRPLTSASDSDLANLGIIKGQVAHLQFGSDIEVHGQVVDWVRNKHRLLLIQFESVKVHVGNEVLFDPAWGRFDMAVGEKVISVFGGAADRGAYGESEDFISARVPVRVLSTELKNRCEFYAQVRRLRQGISASTDTIWASLHQQYFQELSHHWLPALELIELALMKRLDNFSTEVESLKNHLQKFSTSSSAIKECISNGLRLADRKL
ncbi:MAG: aromatic amino acid hydroxylase [Bdellovibrionales bacterium]